ncbi:DNA-3-methyladenine glycosylase [Erysipelotrichaceae bacterium MTC7]|nr:DNA-3-methyladenine glycosylase [Erysipelotrichaceae bacterium MTC7]
MGLNKKRCRWVNLNNENYVKYHDHVWGQATHDDKELFEMLVLESFQAGLSWECILNKQQSFQNAFDQFDVITVSHYTNEKVEALMQDASIVRNRRKILATIQNAKVFQKIQKEYGTFDAYIWSFTEGKTIYEVDQGSSNLSKQISKDLKKRGMNFVGPTIVYSFLQAIGILDCHEPDCYLYQK